jgi:hypothetical protein
VAGTNGSSAIRFISSRTASNRLPSILVPASSLQKSCGTAAKNGAKDDRRQGRSKRRIAPDSPVRTSTTWGVSPRGRGLEERDLAKRFGGRLVGRRQLGGAVRGTQLGKGNVNRSRGPQSPSRFRERELELGWADWARRWRRLRQKPEPSQQAGGSLPGNGEIEPAHRSATVRTAVDVGAKHMSEQPGPALSVRALGDVNAFAEKLELIAGGRWRAGLGRIVRRRGTTWLRNLEWLDKTPK